jgi:hypothetical protein
MAHLELPVLGDRVVEGDDRGDLLLDLQDAVAEALVVVDEVELAGARLEFAGCPGAERERLREHPGHEPGHLEEVFAGLQLPETGEPPGEVVVVGVEAGEPVERDPLVEDRVRLAAEHLDVVAEIGEGFRQVAHVDALAAAVGLAPIGQVRDLERCVRIETGFRHPSEAIGARLPPGNASASPGARHQEMVIVRRSGVSGTTTWGTRLKASGGPDCGSTHVAWVGSSNTTQWSQSDATVTAGATWRS